jgi:hypothetical protein
MLVTCLSAAVSEARGISVAIAAVVVQAEIEEMAVTAAASMEKVLRALAALVVKKRVREACTSGERVVVRLHPLRPLAAQYQTVFIYIVFQPTKEHPLSSLRWDEGS